MKEKMSIQKKRFFKQRDGKYFLIELRKFSSIPNLWKYFFKS